MLTYELAQVWALSGHVCLLNIFIACGGNRFVLQKARDRGSRICY
jgi:hypothetical protein